MKAKKCSCGKAIIFCKSEKSNIPVTIDFMNAEDWEKFNHGQIITFDKNRMLNHFADCPDRNKYRKPKPQTKKRKK